MNRLTISFRCELKRAILLLALLMAAPVFAQGEAVKLSTAGLTETTPSAGTEEPYRVDSGDRLSVDVYREPDLSLRAVKVRDDGSIPFPLLGDVQVKGLTSAEIEALLTRKLADGYLKRPHVRASIDAYRLYYITGEVQRPGGYSFLTGLTIEKVVVLAGGFTERASRTDIKLSRETLADKVLEQAPVDMTIEPGDIITVGESFF